MHTHLAMARHEARSPQGTRAEALQPCHTGHHLTRRGVLALEGIVATLMIAGGTTPEVFFTSLPACLFPHLRPGQVVMREQLKAHTTDAGQTLRASVGAPVESWPPDSPDFAPIEACWAKVHDALRTPAARTDDAVHRAIAHAFKVISAEAAQGWLAHCGSVAH
jgi:hypothetical protein